jgi:hypothetical protein
VAPQLIEYGAAPSTTPGEPSLCVFGSDLSDLAQVDPQDILGKITRRDSREVTM